MIGRPRGGALLLGGAAAVVLLVVGVAVSVLDSPAEERRRRLDQRRVDDLHAIADAIDVHWTEESALPLDLDALAARRDLDLPRTDPVTGAAYRYRVTGGNAYRLCATFATVTPSREPDRFSYRHGSYWHHPAGDHCFELEADEVER